MAEIEPKRFAVESQDGPVKVDALMLHQEIRSDRDGRSHQYIRVSGQATSDLEDFDTIIADLDFAIYDGDERIGTLSQSELTIRSKDHAASFEVEDPLQTTVSAKVTKISIAIDATVVSKANGKAELAPKM